MLFFASLLAHELGHAFVARREGMEIEGITLWLFGGVAKFKGMFPSAGAEFRIASPGRSCRSRSGSSASRSPAWLGLPNVVDGIVGWLGVTNLLLLAFNLLPALPLDGGRVLRSALWAARDDFGWATRLSANIGRAVRVRLHRARRARARRRPARSAARGSRSSAWFLLTASSQEARYVLVATRSAASGSPT